MRLVIFETEEFDGKNITSGLKYQFFCGIDALVRWIDACTSFSVENIKISSFAN